MANRKQIVNFFTNEINVSFVQNEIVHLAAYFDKVNVYAFKAYCDINFPENVIVKEVNYATYSTRSVLGHNFFLVGFIACAELIRAPKYLFNISRYKKAISELLRCFYLADILVNEENVKNKDSINYTFWFNQWASVLSILTKRGGIANYYSRTHGTDLYEERVPNMRRISFRWFQLKYVKKVFSVSKKGTKYLKIKYPNYADKIFCSYLGTSDMGMAKFNKEEIFTIVSCANVRNIKRIHLIPQILEQLDFDVKWVHIGKENLESKDLSIPIYKANKLKLENKKNVVSEFKGAIANSEVFDFYKKNTVNLYVSVSETEGLPVSMMEVISFGIPILSTDVGGCNEIVTNKTGILIPKDFDSVIVANQIKQFRSSEMNDNSFREGVKSFWKENFDGSKNFDWFVNQIAGS